jgi:hypothetical protein
VSGEGEALCELCPEPRSCLPNGLNLGYEDADLIDQRLNTFLHRSGNVLQPLRADGGGYGLGGNGGYKPGMKARRREPHRSVLNDREDYASK